VKGGLSLIRKNNSSPRAEGGPCLMRGQELFKLLLREKDRRLLTRSPKEREWLYSRLTEPKRGDLVGILEEGGISFY